MNNHINEFSWVGSQESFVDSENITYVNQIMVGRYGGNSNAGQYKNEDGCLVWLNEKEDWEFVIVLDAHNTAESAEKVLALFENEKLKIKYLLSKTTSQKNFKLLEEKIVSMFQSEKFLSICQKIQGETACLIVVRKGQYIWWFSVGDCVLYLFHPDLSALGQYQINQRQFYEWIGEVNTFAQAVPCYSVGVRELRQGKNQLFLTTDGLKAEGLEALFRCIKENNVRDNTTIISWKVNNLKRVALPSDRI